MAQTLTRAAVFIDGGFFISANSYYVAVHKVRSDISLRGLLNFVKVEVARLEHTDVKLCTIAEAHWFRGRFTTEQLNSHAGNDRKASGMAMEERQLDDDLVAAGIIQHQFPIHINQETGKASEKAIDVLFSLEAYEVCSRKGYEVAVLVAGDRDYVPLVKKLTALGVRVVLLSWNMEYVLGNYKRAQRTSQHLANECTYVLEMEKLIDTMHVSIPHVRNLFEFSLA